MSAFSLAAEVPEGRLLIEASAGTGKTFTLAGLCTRFVALDGVPMSDLLVVTFTRAATNELRSRVRSALLEAAEHLEGDNPLMTKNAVLDLLAYAPDGSVVGASLRHQRAERLRRALSEFDAATITTMHGFAGQVRKSLGVSTSADPDAQVIQEEEDLIRAAAADVLAAASVQPPLPGALPTLAKLTKAAGNLRRLTFLEPAPTEDDRPHDDQRLFVHLVAEALTLFTQRQRRQGALAFDDVLRDVAEALEAPESAAVREALRKRYRVVLIDEFQDTDSLQWRIFDGVFGDVAGTRLILVGDPKQAIYRFRGADIDAYLQAVAAVGPDRVQRLDTNWRTDEDVLSALEQVFCGTHFGDERIAFTPVAAAPGHEGHRLRMKEGDVPAPLRIRVADGPRVNRRAEESVITSLANRAIVQDLVGHVRHLLEQGQVPAGGDEQDSVDVQDSSDEPSKITAERVASPPRYRDLEPDDVAVLVFSAPQGHQIQQALRQEGIPAVLGKSGSVLESLAAEHLRILLAALEEPARTERARLAALTWFGGWSVEELDQATDAEVQAWQAMLASWAAEFTTKKVSAVFSQICVERAVLPRVVGLGDGDRNQTDLDHLIELLHELSPSGYGLPGALLALLQEDPEEAQGSEELTDLVTRRIETDAQAVQVMTIWSSKGLEFPVVLVPSCWRKRVPGPVEFTRHDGTKALDLCPDAGRAAWPRKQAPEEVGLDWPTVVEGKAVQARKDESAALTRAEELRLLYVAMTRAQHHCALWLARSRDTGATALAHLLFARSDEGTVVPVTAATKPSVPRSGECAARIRVNLAQSAEFIAQSGKTIDPGLIDVDEVDLVSRASTAPWVPRGEAQRAPVVLQVATVERKLDRTSQRWSFSAIHDQSGADHDDHDDVYRSDSGAADEGQVPEESTSDDEAVVAEGPAGSFAPLPAGTEFGTLVHAIYQDADFTAPDLLGELTRVLHLALGRNPFDLRPRQGAVRGSLEEGRTLLVEGVAASLLTPLGGVFAGATLRDLGSEDRLNELSFDLLLGGGGSLPSVQALGRLVQAHLPQDDPFFSWAVGVAEGYRDLVLGGHLTGSIDLVARVVGPDGEPRFVVADYKTNRLRGSHSGGGAPRYSRAAMAEEMAQHDYPLQALLYSVALHRYLRWRLVGYEPSVHIGGASYLFVRGMTGPEVHREDGHVDGVFDWDIPPALVVALSDLLAGSDDGEVVA